MQIKSSKRKINMTIKNKNSTMKFLDKTIGSKMSFGSNLEAIRLADNYNQTEFAKLLGHSEIMFVKIAVQNLLGQINKKNLHNADNNKVAGIEIW